jgi:two-component system chemotaxis response regulator CheB
MHDARVLVVDDSATMRAMFSEILEQNRNIQVIGTAANAVEAMKQIEALKPNVVTLDVEMPGKNGIELLEEIMETKPMPVVMLSSVTQSGADASLKAFELGAVECFPKPLRATPEQFAKIVAKLGKVVLAAANSKPRDASQKVQVRASSAEFQWNGHIVALSASMGGIEALSALLSVYPAQCPPTVIVLQIELGVAQAFIEKQNGLLKCAIKMAADGAPLAQNVVHLVADPSRHVMVEPGSPPKLRLIDRDPIEGVRPSADLLFGTIARAGIPAVGAVLSGMGNDGARGLRLMHDAGCSTLVQSRGSAVSSEAPAAAIAANDAARELGLDDLSNAVLQLCSTN